MKMRSALAFAVLALALGTAPPSASAADESGMTSKGTLVAQATIQGTPLNVGGQIALLRRANLYRLDVLSLGIPGVDSTLGALATQFFAPGGFTIVYDGASGGLTAWSPANKTYYQQAKPATPAPAKPIGPQGAAAADPLSVIALYARPLQNARVFSASFNLIGHSTVNGHPATGVDLDYKRQPESGPLQDIRARLQLADDLDSFPIQIAVDSKATGSGGFNGSMKLDLTSVERTVPAASQFAVPEGYRQVTSLGEVLRRPLN